ncbi:ANTAR domain-containing protein [Arthrobacter frigidicola]|nr:ANTAR domain-containing protein [Arthrobacter frigidicola]
MSTAGLDAGAAHWGNRPEVRPVRRLSRMHPRGVCTQVVVPPAVKQPAAGGCPAHCPVPGRTHRCPNVGGAGHTCGLPFFVQKWCLNSVTSIPENGSRGGEDSTLGQLLNCPTGSYELHFDNGELHWSDEMYRIHGYRRGEIVPSIESGFPHVPQEEQDAVRALWTRLLIEGGPIAGYHSIIDRRGIRRRVLSVGDLIISAGSVVGVRGMLTDLTVPVAQNVRLAADRAVAGSAARRAVIEQAKGILMGRDGISADEAFETLSAMSQHTNRKVAELAQDLVEGVIGRGPTRAPAAE